MIALPASTPPAICGALATAVEAWRASLESRLVSIVLFGSVARGTARDDSDIDLLVVADGFPRSLRDRLQVLLAQWDRVRGAQRLSAVTWNLVTKTPDEARVHSPLYLDIVEDGICLFDREGFFASVLEEMRARMRALGSRRVMLDDGSWYWDLKPDFRFGEVVEI
jgi:predicted nucleotidyltransferase